MSEQKLFRPYFVRKPPREAHFRADEDGEVKMRDAKKRATPQPRAFDPVEPPRIYNFPVPKAGAPVPRVAIISFGGRLVGAWNSTTNVLSSGDVFSQWSQQGVSPTPSVKVYYIGGAVPQDPSDPDSDTENTLDVQALGAACPGIALQLVVCGNNSDGFVTALQYIWNMNPRPNGVSISWGFAENQAPASFVNQINTLLQQFAQAGIWITAACGDTGAKDSTSANVTDFPSSSPWVVACGGTRLLSSSTQYTTTTLETVWNDGTDSATGGGVSAIFAKPPYQSGLTGTMRKTPDVAGVADPNTGINLLADNTWDVIGGTSYTAPMVAGFLAASGCTSFPLPIFYANPNAFHDIVSGNNNGFSAGVGFDDASGLGSINGSILGPLVAGGSGPTPPPPVTTPVTYSIQPTSLVFTTNVSQQLILHASDGSGPPFAGSLWQSSNLAVATVNAVTGVVAPVANGTATISNSLVPTGVTATVRGLTKPVTAIQVYPSVKVGGTLAVTVFFTPTDAPKKQVVYSSTNPAIASVNASTGLVTGRSVGLVSIIGMSSDTNHATSAFTLAVVAA